MKFTLEGVGPSLNGPFQVSMTSGGELLEEIVRRNWERGRSTIG